jgi:hypothetical protein
MAEGGLGSIEADRTKDLSTADICVTPVAGRDETPDGGKDSDNDIFQSSPDLLSDYVTAVHNLPLHPAVNRTLIETDHNPGKLDSLRKALFGSAVKSQKFPKGNYLLKRRINRGGPVPEKLAKDCALLSAFISGGEFADIQDMFNTMLNPPIEYSLSTPRARRHNMSSSQGEINTNQCECRAEVEELRDIIVQLRADYAMITVKVETQEQELADIKTKCATLLRSDTEKEGEITQLYKDLRTLEDLTTKGVGANRARIVTLSTNATDTKQFKDDVSETLSTISTDISRNGMSISDLCLRTDRLHDEKAMGICQVKSQVKLFTQGQTDLDEKIEQAVQGNKTLTEGNMGLRARIGSIEKATSMLSKRADTVPDRQNASETTNHMEGMEARISNALCNFVTDIKGQFADLTGSIKHSLTEITAVVKPDISHSGNSGHGGRGDDDMPHTRPRETIPSTTGVLNHTRSQTFESALDTSFESISTALPGGDVHPVSTHSNATNPACVRPLRSSPYIVTPGPNTACGDYPLYSSERGSENSNETIKVRISTDQCATTMEKDSKSSFDDGFVGVSKRQTVRYFLSGIRMTSTSEDIKSYLADRNVSVSVVRMMSSRRHNTQSARVNISKEDASKVNEPGFWPKGVMHRKWQSNATFNNRRDQYTEDNEDSH